MAASSQFTFRGINATSCINEQTLTKVTPKERTTRFLDKNATCIFCNNSFTRSRNLYAHIRNVHKVTIRLHGKVTCPIESCCEGVKDYSNLRNHLKEMHNVVVEKEELIFDSMSEFEQWKVLEEEKTVSSYAKTTRNKIVGGKRKHFFSCHRSGTFKSKSLGKRSLKSQNSCKIGRHCPSTMEVIEGNNNVHVLYFKTHVGHMKEISHMALPQSTKEAIAEKLKEGATEDEILDEIRDSIRHGDGIKRVHLITKRDIKNIKTEFNIITNEPIHPDDVTNASTWVEEMLNLAESPVIEYKPQGVSMLDLKVKDFLLILMTPMQQKLLGQLGPPKICIDSTHGTKSYNLGNFQLLTLIAIDEYGEGYPIAFCLSNRIDQVVIELFFSSVKKATGTVDAYVFMSDDNPAYYAAWSKVMGKCQFVLLCSWHVDYCWRKHLNKVKGNTIKRAVLYKRLRTLLQETDSKEFQELLLSFINDLQEDSETKIFGDFFKNAYCKRQEMWAFSFHKTCGINTNLYLEAMHHAIKQVYMNGNVVKHLSNCTMQTVRDKTYEHLVKHEEGKKTFAIMNIKERHQKSTTIAVDHICMIENGWLVESQQGTGHYFVQKKEEKCPIFNCQLQCFKCCICVHSFSCNCVDATMHQTICKHIHAVVMYASPTWDTSHHENSNLENNIVCETASDCDGETASDCDGETAEESTILNKWKSLDTLVQKYQVSSKEEKIILKHLDSMLQIYKIKETEQLNRINASLAGPSYQTILYHLI